jgi:hypothetical protein
MVVRRIWILNLSLVAVLTAVSVRLYNESIMFNATHQTGAVGPEREAFAKLPFALPPNPAVPANWTDIPSHNPFSFDRTDIAILEPKAPPPPPPPPKIAVGPKPLLFGTMSLGNDRMAMVGLGKAGNRDYKPMKVGEVIDGWTILSIDDKSIVVKGNEVQETILLNDPTAQIPRDHTRTLDSAPATPNAISVGASSSLPTPPPASPAASPSGTQPAAQPGQRRKVTQVTPFGIREIEVEEPPK